MQPASVFKGCWVPSPALSGSHKGLSSVGWEGMTLADFGSECLCVYLCMHQVCPAACVCEGDVFVCMSVFAYDPMCSLAQMCMHARAVRTRGLCPLKGVPASQLRVTMIWSRTGTNMSEETNDGRRQKSGTGEQSGSLWTLLQILQTRHQSQARVSLVTCILCSGNVHYQLDRDYCFTYATRWVTILKSNLGYKCFILLFYNVRANYYPGGLCCLQKLPEESPKASTHVRINLALEVRC